MNKETLDDILRVGRRVATPSNECIKRWPVCFTKSGECFPRSLIGIGLACLQYDRPVRRLKRSTSLLQGSRYRFRSHLLSARPAGFAMKITWLWISYGLLFIGELTAWWIPYLFHSQPERAARYQAMFGATHGFLPERNGIRPNTLHVILHIMTLTALVLLGALS